MEPTFSISDTLCKLGKISNNLEKHGEEDVPEFNIPIRGVLLNADQLNALSACPYAHRSMFNINGNAQTPMDWVASYAPFVNPVRFENINASIHLQSDEDLDFEKCHAKDFSLTPKVGGFTELNFTLQLCPGLDRENLLLQEYQNREVRITIMDAKVARKKSARQKELPLQQPAPAEGENYDHDAAKRIAQANETEAELREQLRAADHDRQLEEAARHHEKQQDAAA